MALKTSIETGLTIKMVLADWMENSGLVRYPRIT